MTRGEGNAQQPGCQAQGAVVTVAGVDYPGLVVIHVVPAPVIEFFSQTLHRVDVAIE